MSDRQNEYGSQFSLSGLSLTFSFGLSNKSIDCNKRRILEKNDYDDSDKRACSLDDSTRHANCFGNRKRKF